MVRLVAESRSRKSLSRGMVVIRAIMWTLGVV